MKKAEARTWKKCLESAEPPIFAKPFLDIFPIVHSYLGKICPIGNRAVYAKKE